MRDAVRLKEREFLGAKYGQIKREGGCRCEIR